MFDHSKYILADILKNKVIIGFTGLLVACGWGTFLLESQPEKALLMLMQVTLLLLPVITMVFASVYYYNSAEFIMLLLSHPIGRFAIFKALYLSLTVSFIVGFGLGICLPLFVFYPVAESLFLAAGGVFLITIFTALAMYVSVLNKDKARGLGVALLLWAFFAFLYDGILIYIMYQLSNYPIERPILLLTFLNPIDIARILVIMKTEVSAILGLSGAVFQQFFGSSTGAFVSVFLLVLWSVLPFVFAWKVFAKKDF